MVCGDSACPVDAAAPTLPRDLGVLGILPMDFLPMDFLPTAFCFNQSYHNIIVSNLQEQGNPKLCLTNILMLQIWSEKNKHFYNNLQKSIIRDVNVLILKYQIVDQNIVSRNCPIRSYHNFVIFMYKLSHRL